VSRPSTSRLADVVLCDEPGVARIPALVKGELIHPRHVGADTLGAAAEAAVARNPAMAAGGEALRFRFEELQAIREPLLEADGSVARGRWRYLLLPRPAPESLVERDAAELARTLHALPFREVLAFAAALRELLEQARATALGPAATLQGGGLLDERLLRLAFDLIPAIFEPGALAESVDRELGSEGRPGREFLDGWVEVPAEAVRGMMARMADGVFDAPPAASSFRPSLRALPTRQLHITPGNSPIIPLLSFLRGLLTKGACVVKSPAEACAVTAVLAAAMHALDPTHPITRHTSLVYWPGGDLEMETPLLAPGAFDRVVVWGSAPTVRSVRQRAGLTRTVSFNPRYGASLIGRAAFEGSLDEVAARASVDTLIWDQKACTASLVHYVEGDEAQVLDYCRALQRALARWDTRLPRPLPRSTLGRLRLLRRGELLNGTWFENGTPPEVRSAVVYAPGPFDLSLHPMSRLVVVRRVRRLPEAIPFLGSATAAVGVFPDEAVAELRDTLGAAGVSNVFPLGECERSYPGIPHDGMRTLSELVSWTSSGTRSPA